MRAARTLAVPAALAFLLAACTDGARVAQPTPSATGECADVQRIVPSEEDVQAFAEELRAAFESLQEQAAEIERMTSVIEVEDWLAFGAALEEALPPSVFVGEPQADGGRDYHIAWTGSGIDLKEIETNIRDALEETASMIRANLTDAIAGALEASAAPERLQALAECLEVPRWLAAGKAPQPSAKERAIIDDLRLFARSGRGEELAGVPLLDEGVWLGLGADLLVRRSPEELADNSSWRLEKKAFRGYVGPFSPLDFLADPRPAQVTVGPHSHCASPPMPAPARVAALRRLSVQPKSTESCLDWYTVDLFLTPQGEVAAITMDLYEP